MEDQELVDACVLAAYEANRAYCRSLGDCSHRPHGEAPAWQLIACAEGVRAVLRGEHSPERLHELWMEAKLAAGWTLGPLKDEDAKTHPCLVPYDALPRYQKAKDRLFAAVVLAVLDAYADGGAYTAKVREVAFDRTVPGIG